ncbi:MAG: septum formation inhibitor Maf [Verrucomicrobia bacterium]|nr:MAG: septum formation inhibitor Maf [Verrucomicrobiota bacterium]
MPENFDIILASRSPRRRDLLGLLGRTFRIVEPTHAEQRLPGEHAADYAVRNAREKARSVRHHAGTTNFLIIGADTIVVLDERILEKPRDAAHARAMLRALSDRTHEVITGLALLTAAGEKCSAVRTAVTFRALSDAEIETYITTGEPFDKAGAYGIQGHAAHLVTEIRGSYTNVVGLPLAEVAEALNH